jgi:hypothetical protein
MRTTSRCAPRTVTRLLASFAVAAMVATACAPADDPEDTLPDPDEEPADPDADDVEAEPDDPEAVGDVADDETFTIAVGVDFDTFDPAGPRPRRSATC